MFQENFYINIINFYKKKELRLCIIYARDYGKY